MPPQHLSPETIALSQRMARENPLLNASRQAGRTVRGELLKLGLHKTTGIELIHTPYQSPLANPIGAPFAAKPPFSVRSARRECPDPALVLGVRQRVRVLTAHVRSFNALSTPLSPDCIRV